MNDEVKHITSMIEHIKMFGTSYFADGSKTPLLADLEYFQNKLEEWARVPDSYLNVNVEPMTDLMGNTLGYTIVPPMPANIVYSGAESGNATELAFRTLHGIPEEGWVDKELDKIVTNYNNTNYDRAMKVVG